MEQLLVRIYDAELTQFYLKYREAQSGNVARPFPPGKQSVKLPLVTVTANFKTCTKPAMSLFFNVTLTDLETGKPLCVVHVDAQSYHNDLAAHLAWEPEAADFASGFLDWLHGSFRTDTGQEPLTPKERERLETIKNWPGGGKKEYADTISIDVHTLATWAKELHAKGYDTDWHRTGRKHVR